MEAVVDPLEKHLVCSLQCLTLCALHPMWRMQFQRWPYSSGGVFGASNNLWGCELAVQGFWSSNWELSQVDHMCGEMSFVEVEGALDSWLQVEKGIWVQRKGSLISKKGLFLGFAE